MAARTPYHGEIKCQGVKGSGETCTNGAYFACGSVYLCGVHSKSKERMPLTKLPKSVATEMKQGKKDETYQAMMAHANVAAKINYDAKQPGRVCLVHIAGRYVKPALREGWINVYPNYMSAWQGVGIVLPQLSPMSLGPVNTGQPGLPPASCIENMHQGNKMYDQYEDYECFRVNRLLVYQYTKPIRRKFPMKYGLTLKVKSMPVAVATPVSNYPVAIATPVTIAPIVVKPFTPTFAPVTFNPTFTPIAAPVTFAPTFTPATPTVSIPSVAPVGNEPSCSMWIDKDGKEHILSGTSGYITSRQFYCTFYMRLAESAPIIQEYGCNPITYLRMLIGRGYNLQICGPDARHIETLDALYAAYLDPSKPFGHEFVILCMLIIADPASYPWTKHKTFDF